MDNEFKRRLIRHLETAQRTYQHRLEPPGNGPKCRAPNEPQSTAELAEACDDCAKMLAMLKRAPPTVVTYVDTAEQALDVLRNMPPKK